ncbi:MAG: ABC transporter substrate-binding protein [Clostridiales bacterium]|jgi:peptide/nickel transport system substrate-binding protein|nr:ABC transporter substrate-binding protein [Clostridiales bacterium]
MKKPRTIVALLLAAIFVLSGMTACQTDGQQQQPAGQTEPAAEPAAEPASSGPSGTITIGETTEINADFMTGWTNVSPNSRIKSLIHGGNDTYAIDPQGQYQLNTRVVENLATADNEDGTKTFTFELTGDRVWSDGTPITAKDYVFALLMTSSPEFQALGANAIGGYDYVGYDAYLAGETKVFTGIRLLGEQSLSVTVKAEELPQYYDYLMAVIGPYPFHHLAPGVTLSDDGEGAYMSDEWTPELAQQTISNDSDGTGYRYNPTVTCGAYKLVSFDTTDLSVVLEANPNFCGTWDGVMPSIQTIIFRRQTQATQMQELENGVVDLIPGVSAVAQIEEGLALVDNGVAVNDTFYRYGYGLIRFHCDQGPTSFASVRQAIAFCLDREEFNRAYASGYAITVDSAYSLAHYIYQDNKEYLEENLIHYTLDPERAVEILEADGWMMGEDGIRHKEVDGEDMPLVVEWLSSTDNTVSDLLRTMLVPEAAKIGIKINETAVSSVLDAASRRGIRDEEAQYFMFNMALNFGNPDLPYNSYSLREEFWGGNYNNNYIRDEELDRITGEMYYMEPGNKEAFDEKYLEYIIRYNELMPNIPLYSNTYFDFYSPRLQNYDIDSLYDLRYAILYATLAE